MPVQRELRVGFDMDRKIHVARFAAVQSWLAFAGDADFLSVLDTGRHVGFELFAIHAQRHRGALDRLAEGQGDVRFAVGALLRFRRFPVFAAVAATERGA